jgi:hypothetical protein
VPGRTKKYITMAGNDVCENVWYIIHGVSRSAYHNYKAVARGGFCNGSDGNTGMSRPRPRTIQAEANLMTIISGNADRMPNEFRCIGGSRVNNVLVLPCTLNWDNMWFLSNSVMSPPQFLIPDLVHCIPHLEVCLLWEVRMDVKRNLLRLHPKSAARRLQRGC